MHIFSCREFELVHLTFLLAVFGVSAVPDIASSQTDKTNVIVIIVDDAGYADFGFTNPVTGKTGFDGFGEGTGADPNQPIPSLTPRIDALARSGVILSRAYVAANCQPTRAAVVTGAYQQRVGNENVGNNNFAAGEVFEGIPNDTITIWDYMKAEGYTTGAVGKWHLGQLPEQTIDGKVFEANRPQNQAIDEFRGHWHGSRTFRVGDVRGNVNSKNFQNQALREAVVTRDANGNITNVTDQIIETQIVDDTTDHPNNYITESFGVFGADFIKAHANDENPFMLYQSFTAPHKPWESYSPDYNDPRIAHLRGDNPTADEADDNKIFARRKVASMMISLENEVGRMLDALEDPNVDGNTSDSIADDTLIVFVNDNGGVSGTDEDSGVTGIDNGPFDGFKGSMKDGGIRIPMFIAGKGVTNGGTTYDSPVHGIDIVPTAVAAAGGSFGADDKIDGVDLLPFINGQNADRPHDVLAVKWQGGFSIIREEDNGDIYKLVNSQRNPAINYSNRENNYRLYLTKDADNPSNSNVGEVGNNASDPNNLINDPNLQDLARELRRDLTKHEAFFDKGRYAILSRYLDDDMNNPKFGTADLLSDESNVSLREGRNIFDHFVFNPNGGNQDWSDTDGWFAKDNKDFIPNSAVDLDPSDPNYSPEKTLYLSDAFAGAILEFGTSDSQSYAANNDMFRQTGGDCMLNKILLSGDSGGSQDQTGMIQGNPLLFTNDLEGVAPQIAIEANQSADNQFAYTISNEIQLFDNLTIAGDGDVSVTISGVIRDYYSEVSADFDPNSRHNNDDAFGARGITKIGASTATLTGTNTYSGRTVVEEGTLALSGDGSIDNSSEIEVKAGATLDATGHNTGGLNLSEGQTLMGSGEVLGGVAAAANTTVAPGSSVGLLTINGDMSLNSTTDVEIEVGPGTFPGTDFDQLQVNGVLSLSSAELLVLADDPNLFNSGDEFQIFQANSITGDFSNIVLPQLRQGLAWNTSQLGNGGSGLLSISGTAIPEPSSITLLALCGVLGSVRRRRG